MSRHREMLRALLRVGKSPDDISAEVPISPTSLARTFADDWPIQKRFVAPLEAYAERTLREAHARASTTNKPEIEDAYLAAFGLPLQQALSLSTDALRATYGAWLLGVRPDMVFPHGPESTEEADEHFAQWMRQLVAPLLEEARHSTDRSPEALRYIATLCHVDDVLEGRDDAARNGWFSNRAGYRRGVYVFAPASAARRRVE